MHFDLRKYAATDEIRRAELALRVQFDMVTAVRKRRSIGFRTDRGTWVRVEVQAVDKLGERGWNGVEGASVLRGVAKPEWHESVSWIDGATGRLWRADETDFISVAPIKSGGVLRAKPELSESWWSTLSDSLTALAGYVTSRVAVGQARFIETIHRVFPGLAR
jgi:hypothetical protein